MSSTVLVNVYKTPAAISCAETSEYPIKIEIYGALKNYAITKEQVDKVCSKAWSQFVNGSPTVQKNHFYHHGKRLTSLMGKNIPVFQCKFQYDKGICRLYINLKTSEKVKNSDGSYDRDAFLITMLRDGGSFQEDRTGRVKRRLIIPTDDWIKKTLAPSERDSVQSRDNFKIEEKELPKFGVKDISGYIDAQCYFCEVNGKNGKNERRIAVYYGFSGNKPAEKVDAGDSKSNEANENAPSANAGTVVSLDKI